MGVFDYVKSFFNRKVELEMEKKKVEKVLLVEKLTTEKVFKHVKDVLSKYVKNILIKTIILLSPIVLLILGIIDVKITAVIVSIFYLAILGLFLYVVVISFVHIKSLVLTHKFNVKQFVHQKLYDEILLEAKLKASESFSVVDKFLIRLSSYKEEDVKHNTSSKIAHEAAQRSTNRLFAEITPLLVKPVASFALYVITFEFFVLPHIMENAEKFDDLSLHLMFIAPVCISIDTLFGTNLSEVILHA
ncbi:MAG: hypothetical protein KU37_10850 [Sulfuricurvum sp. PC08-66]|nr:MAG: hypothetical protein KU37_10850 [Sulfuricurvum sp. PC08-66]